MANIGEETLENELRALIAEIVEITPSDIGLESKFVEDLGMDSMMALEILASMEKKYKIRIPEEKLNQLTDLREAVKLTQDYLKAV